MKQIKITTTDDTFKRCPVKFWEQEEQGIWRKVLFFEEKKNNFYDHIRKNR